MTEMNEYELGEEVTSRASTKQKKGTAILSVRVSNEELARLEQAARSSGKSVSQLVREAIGSFAAHATRSANYGVVISQEESVVTFGYVSSSGPVSAETWHEGVYAFSR